ncbi:hypothetical protein C2845_PM07G01330 [Panicum miliaceum]|uniref:Core Histone H2A/H2B/H3 domain-containing protein n=1 Tax=Panicum miliaceum TaxID=4540 RepID=A0A3L6SRQ4_PANMI|nr:hypothetical protein C2845_PM07G01330 [Panicum miliaceum]
MIGTGENNTNLTMTILVEEKKGAILVESASQPPIRRSINVPRRSEVAIRGTCPSTNQRSPLFFYNVIAPRLLSSSQPPKPKAEKRLPAGKSAGKEGGEGKKGKKKAKKSVETYKIYIFKVLKQVHPDIGISSKAMSIMNSFINDIFEKLAGEAAKLARYNNKPTVISREIQTSVCLVLPRELTKHAVSEGTKAVTKFTSS